MYATQQSSDHKKAKTLYTLFRVFELDEQHRAIECPTQIEHLEQMRILPATRVASTRYKAAHRGYRPIAGGLLESLSTKLETEDIAADPRWATDATVLTTSNTARASILGAAAVNYGERNGEKVISWRRPLNLDMSDGVRNHLYTNGENPEITAFFVKGAPGQILDNRCGNVSLRVANGTACLYHSLIWIDDDVRARMQAKISASNSRVVHVDVAPDYIVVELPEHDAATWPDHLNLCPEVDGERETVLIPIGISSRGSGDNGKLKIDNIELTFKSHGVDLAFALTVWKAQGKTLSHVIALLDGGPGHSLTYECMYVIKSRVPALDRIKCLGVAADPREILSKLRPCPLAVRYRQDIAADGYWKG
jgi:hypothetical protein